MERLVSAVERMAPAVATPSDWTSAPGYRWSKQGPAPVMQIDARPLASLVGIDRQKQAVLDNVTQFAKGHAAHDMLLWGARGMGKSALVTASVADVQQESGNRIALVEIPHHAMASLPDLFDELSRLDRAFLLLLDDLGFAANAASQILGLRSALEGGIAPRPANVRLAVTSNRRAIVSRDHSEQDSPLNARDDRDDALALADRFGLSLGFHPCDRDTYLAIVRTYLDPLGVTFCDEDAMAWSISRGALSGRAAHQFATEVAGRAGKPLA